MTHAPTFVLDTNAWLDLLVFHDPALSGLGEAIEACGVRVAIDARAVAELSRVLRYDALRLDEATAAMHLSRAMRLSCAIDASPRPLPRCRDPDDQMFLEIAVAARADALLTRDSELLRMARRMARDHGVAILEPRGWRAFLDAERA